jgi:hypothetical protein
LRFADPLTRTQSAKSTSRPQKTRRLLAAGDHIAV